MATVIKPSSGRGVRDRNGSPATMRGVTGRWLSLWAALSLALAGTAFAQSGEPVLRIEAETHTAVLRNAAADAAGRVLVTVSDDKTARVWSLPDLRLLTVLRPPIGDGNQGKLYAVAVSQDGRTAAVGGWSVPEAGSYSVYIFDLATSAITRRISGLSGATDSLAFARDGRLAAGLASNKGIRVWREGTLQFQDTDYSDEVNGLSFAPDGTLAAGASNGKLRLYDRNGRILHTVDTEAGKDAFSLRFSPDGTKLAVGFDDVAAVEVREGNTLALRSRPVVTGLNGRSLAKVGWSADGGTLMAGGNVWGSSDRPVFCWPDGGTADRRIAADGFVAGINAIVPLPGDNLVVASFSGDMAVSTLGNRRLFERHGVGGDLRTDRDPSSPAWRLKVAADGKMVEWVTLPAQRRILRFDPARLDLRAGETETNGLTAWASGGPGMRVTDWYDTTAPKLNGLALELKEYERAFSVSAAHSRLLLGTAWYLRRFAADGSPAWSTSTPAAAWRVNQSPDGRLAIAAIGDSTIRWYRADNGHELLALYVTEDAGRWIAFTPSGYYAAAPGAEDLIGWHVNRGPDEAGDFFPASRFRDRFYRPDVVSRILTTLDEAEALKQADAARGVATRPAEAITDDLPPVVRIVTPFDGTSIDGGEITLEYTVRSPSGKPISALTVLIDGQRPSFAAVPTIPTIAAKDRETKGHLSVPIPLGKTVEVALSASTTRDGDAARIRVTSLAPPVDFGLPRLNGVLIGVASYPIAGMKLNFAAKDAHDIKTEFEKQKSRHALYREVTLPIVEEQAATRKGILAALRALRERNTEDDVALVFLSGHGVQVGTRTFFLPFDVDPGDLDSTAISKADLLDLLSSIKGRKLLFLDICHAGAFEVAGKSRIVPDMTLLLNELRSTSGIVVFSSSSGSQSSEELPQGNGAFTAAVLDGLRGAAAVGTNGMIDTDDLDAFVTFDVRKLTQGRQSAKMLRTEGMPDFPIFALAR